MEAPPPASWDYRRAGVDREGVGKALSALLGEVKYRPPASSGRPLRAEGHYAGLVRLGRETLAITTDTVGTKVLLAEALGRWEEVGEDIVGVNVNDLAAIGARPTGLVDVISCARPETETFRAIGRGLERGLRKAKCALLGGETAMVPEIVAGTDLGGTAIGFFPKGRRPVTGRAIRPGDVILGIPSSGVHANGFTLVRRLLKTRQVALDRPRPDGSRPVGQELLAPTRIYSGAADAVAGLGTVHGLAHISGGGVRNLLRLHPRRAFVLDGWPAPPPLFRWLAELGTLAPEEQYQTLNMGIGFVLIVARGAVPAVLRRLSRAGAPDALPIGYVESGEGVSLPGPGLRYRGYHG